MYVNKENNEEIEAIQFYVDNMADFFFDKVGTDEVVLRKCDYKRYSKKDVHSVR